MKPYEVHIDDTPNKTAFQFQVSTTSEAFEYIEKYCHMAGIDFSKFYICDQNLTEHELNTGADIYRSFDRQPQEDMVSIYPHGESALKSTTFEIFDNRRL